MATIYIIRLHKVKGLLNYSGQWQTRVSSVWLQIYMNWFESWSYGMYFSKDLQCDQCMPVEEEITYRNVLMWPIVELDIQSIWSEYIQLGEPRYCCPQLKYCIWPY